MSSKQAEARSVMAQIQELDSRLGKAVESYNLANVRLEKIQGDLRENAFELKLAKGNLKVGQKRMAKRLVELYTSGGSGSAMEVILGAQSLDDLITRLEAVDRVTSLDEKVVKQVRFFKESTKKHAQLLAEAIGSHPGLELLAPVPLSAVCFRHRVKDNEAILQRVIARGRVYLSNATINGQFALRACFVNHRTEAENVYEIVSEVIAAADELNA